MSVTAKKCTKCKRALSLDKFVKGFDENGYDFWCSECRKKYCKDLATLQEYCLENDRYFHENLWKEFLDEAKEHLGVKKVTDNVAKRALGFYFRRMNMKGFFISLSEKEGTKNSDEIVSQEMVDFEITQDMIDKWGTGYSKKDYWFLDREWNNLTSSYECETPIQRMLYEEIAITRLQLTKQRTNSKSYKDLLSSLSNLLNDANIKPVQETGANSAEQSTFGILIKKWENERPIPEPDEEFKDVDNIIKYIRVWFLGHLCKMLGIKNEYSQQYEEEIAKYTVDTSDDDEGVS